MILTGIFMAIYRKSVFSPYDSNIKFYNATVLKMLKTKLHFIKKMAKAKKLIMDAFTCSKFSLFFNKNHF